ncbi:unnamed protein product, partial [Prorocentrum cordatum]
EEPHACRAAARTLWCVRGRDVPHALPVRRAREAAGEGHPRGGAEAGGAEVRGRRGAGGRGGLQHEAAGLGARAGARGGPPGRRGPPAAAARPGPRGPPAARGRGRAPQRLRGGPGQGAGVHELRLDQGRAGPVQRHPRLHLRVRGRRGGRRAGAASRGALGAGVPVGPGALGPPPAVCRHPPAREDHRREPPDGAAVQPEVHQGCLPGARRGWAAGAVARALGAGRLRKQGAGSPGDRAASKTGRISRGSRGGRLQGPPEAPPQAAAPGAGCPPPPAAGAGARPLAVFDGAPPAAAGAARGGGGGGGAPRGGAAAGALFSGPLFDPRAPPPPQPSAAPRGHPAPLPEVLPSRPAEAPGRAEPPLAAPPLAWATQPGAGPQRPPPREGPRGLGVPPERRGVARAADAVELWGSKGMPAPPLGEPPWHPLPAHGAPPGAAAPWPGGAAAGCASGLLGVGDLLGFAPPSELAEGPPEPGWVLGAPEVARDMKKEQSYWAHPLMHAEYEGARDEKAAPVMPMQQPWQAEVLHPRGFHPQAELCARAGMGGHRAAVHPTGVHFEVGGPGEMVMQVPAHPAHFMGHPPHGMEFQYAHQGHLAGYRAALRRGCPGPP